MRRNTVWALVLLCVACPAMGQRLLTLDTCRSLALQHQVRMQTARLGLQQAVLDRESALTRFLPTVSASAAYFRSLVPLLDYESGQELSDVTVTLEEDGTSAESRLDELQRELDDRGIDVNLRDEVRRLSDDFPFTLHVQALQRGFYAGALAVQPVFAGGRIVNGNKLASLGVAAAELQLLMTRDEVELNVEQSYWQVVSLCEKRRTVAQALQLLDTLERDAAAAWQAGVVGKTDWLKVRLKRNELLSARTTLENGIRLATLALLQYVGLPAEGDSAWADYRLADSLDAMVEPATLFCPDTTAVAHRKELRLLELAERAELLRKRMAVGELLPQLSVGASYGMNNVLSDHMRANALVFFSLNVPVSAWWQKSREVEKQDLAQQAAALQRRDAAERMRLQTRQCWNELTESYEQVALARESADDAAANLAEVASYYRAGLVSVGDYLEAQMLLQQARNDYADRAIECKLRQLRYRQLTQ